MNKDIDTQTQSSICKGLDKGHSTSFSYPNPILCHISTLISAILRKPSLSKLERTWANFMNTWSINKYSLKNISLYINRNIYKEQRGMNKSFYLHSLILHHPWSLSTAGFSAIQDSCLLPPSFPLCVWNPAVSYHDHFWISPLIIVFMLVSSSGRCQSGERSQNLI